MNKLSEIAEINMGQSPSSDSYNQEKEGLPFFQGKADFGEIYPTARIWCNNPIKIAEKDDILMSVRAPVGNLNIVNEKCCIGRGLAGIKAIKSKCYYKYLYYFLKSKYNELNQKSTGSTFKAINKENILSIQGNVHTKIKEQVSIADKLDKVQEIIDIRKKQIGELEELIKSQFVELFGNPIQNDKKWNTDTINNVAPIQNYKGTFENKAWLLNLDMVESNSGKIVDYIFEDIDNIGNSTCTFNEENILYSKLRPYLNKVVIPNKKGYATSELVPLKPNKDKLNRYFLAYLLRSEQFVQYISQKVAGAKMPRVSMDMFRKFNLILPPLLLQNQFAEFVKQIDKQKFKIQKSLEEIQQLQESLMNQYFG